MKIAVGNIAPGRALALGASCVLMAQLACAPLVSLRAATATPSPSPTLTPPPSTRSEAPSPTSSPSPEPSPTSELEAVRREFFADIGVEEPEGVFIFLDDWSEDLLDCQTGEPKPEVQSFIDIGAAWFWRPTDGPVNFSIQLPRVQGDLNTFVPDNELTPGWSVEVISADSDDPEPLGSGFDYFAQFGGNPRWRGMYHYAQGEFTAEEILFHNGRWLGPKWYPPGSDLAITASAGGNVLTMTVPEALNWGGSLVFMVITDLQGNCDSLGPEPDGDLFFPLPEE